MTLEQVIEKIEWEIDNAREVAKANRAGGSPPQSVAYDEGRYAGLRDALDIVVIAHSPS